MALLLTLPHEILHHVLNEVDPQDLAPLSLSCRALHRFIKNNKTLYKCICLKKLDPPPHCTQKNEPNWELEILKLVKFEEVLSYDDNEKKEQHVPFIARTMTEYLRTASPRTSRYSDGELSKNVALLAKYFEDKQNQDVFLCNSTLFERARSRDMKTVPPSLPLEGRHLSAKLHCLYGIPIESTGRTRSSKTYPYACSKVYDLRNYTDKTMWGPFMEDGSGNVDWERVEAIMVVLGYNLRLFTANHQGMYKAIWARPLVESVPNSYISYSVPRPSYRESELGMQDPYGISGTWMRIVCFLDYTELFAYNFESGQSPPPGEPRPPLDNNEVIRLIVMELRVTSIEPPGKNDGQELPVVCFRGTARSMHASWDPNANSTLQGRVRLTKEGEVRWTSLSIFGGEERWRSEGIQVGGIRSARGVIGNWFDKDYDVRGPAGPTAFWKISDEIDDSDEEDDDG